MKAREGANSSARSRGTKVKVCVGGGGGGEENQT